MHNIASILLCSIQGVTNPSPLSLELAWGSLEQAAARWGGLGQVRVRLDVVELQQIGFSVSRDGSGWVGVP